MVSYSSGTPSSVVVSRDGVTVEKSFGSDDFPIPTITFVIRSERSEAVDVRFVDPVPDDVALEGVGFHPRFGSEHWSIEDEDIAFERSMEPNEEFTTVYGLRGKDVVEPDRLMSEPLIERVDPSYADSAEARFIEGEAEEPADGRSTDTGSPDVGSVETGSTAVESRETGSPAAESVESISPDGASVDPAPADDVGAGGSTAPSADSGEDGPGIDGSQDESVVPGADKPSFAADAVPSGDADSSSSIESPGETTREGTDDAGDVDSVPTATDTLASNTDASGAAEEPAEATDITPQAAEESTGASQAADVEDSESTDLTETTTPDPNGVEESEEADHEPDSTSESRASSGSDDTDSTDSAADSRPGRADQEGTDDEDDIELVDSIERPSVIDGNGSNTVAAVLAREIRDGAVEASDLETIQSALGTPPTDHPTDSAGEGSMDARVKHLQTRIADFDAYVDALEAFLDENGDAQTLLSDLRTDIRELDGRILSVEDRIDEVETATNDRIEEATSEIDTEFDSLWEDLDIAQAAIADLEAEKETLEDTVEEFVAAIDTVDDLEREFDAVTEDVARLDEQLSELSAMRDQLNRVFGGAEE